MTTRSTYPDWLFDGSPIDDPLGYGERAVNFLRLLKHPKSAAPKRALMLDEWQDRIVRRIYGPRDQNGHRIVKTVVLLLPRGNRKTSLAAALSLLHTIGPERRPGGEAIFAAGDRPQASLGFKEAAGIIREDKRLVKATRIYDAHNSVKKIVFNKDGSFLEAISGEGAPAHGRTPAFAFVDELHIWKNADLWTAIKSGLPKTQGSLLIIATTAGRGQDNIAHEIVDRARKVARGDIDDPSLLPILFETPDDADWRDEALWHRANPGLALGYQDIEGLRQLAREGETSITARETFRQYNLNVWLDRSTDPFVEMAVYDQGADPVDLEALKGRPCWLGVDLSSQTDLTVIVAAWRDDDGGFTVLPIFFCPKMNLREREEQTGAPYLEWERQGLITATDGNVVDFDAVEAAIRDLCDRFEVTEIAFDPALARSVLNSLQKDGYPAVEMRQGALTMMPAIAELERAIVAGKFRHGGNPVLRFNFANVEVERNKQQHAVRFVKSKRWLSIDGAVAAAMAVSRAAAGESGRSLYDDPALKPEDFVWS
ncbi:Terminase [Rhodopseudomonas palustris TIE-1]|uniref:terminase large subunit n=1 Tax=Rhodopseudomonas palustris TaxID=1076 RepID=UPI000164B2DE|nr:terminase TerL endonuclease subunit [Rhodopseudomonas palustris]ACF02485.1 Terminase [Rhodopseudomonas palustris TIE-1]